MQLTLQMVLLRAAGTAPPCFDGRLIGVSPARILGRNQLGEEAFQAWKGL
jgi:hypothetical protein